MALTFEWDPFKAQKNLKDHGISFIEASTVFDDEQGIAIFDPDHSESEDRFILFGQSTFNHYLMVVHLDLNEVIRIISARKMTNNERKVYEKEILRRKGL